MDLVARSPYTNTCTCSHLPNLMINTQACAAYR